MELDRSTEEEEVDVDALRERLQQQVGWLCHVRCKAACECWQPDVSVWACRHCGKFAQLAEMKQPCEPLETPSIPPTPPFSIFSPTLPAGRSGGRPPAAAAAPLPPPPAQPGQRRQRGPRASRLSWSFVGVGACDPCSAEGGFAGERRGDASSSWRRAGGG